MDASPNDATSGAHSNDNALFPGFFKYVILAGEYGWMVVSPFWDAWFQ